MLLSCPECAQKVSDKALSCPHCGYPMKTFLKNSPREKFRSKIKRPRLPNGFGQITELKNQNLRNRFRVMVSDGKTEYGRPIQKLLQPRAYFSSYKEAYEALLEYHKNPYDPSKELTVKQLYEEWITKYKATAKTSTSYRSYNNAWNYCAEVENMLVRDLRPRHIKHCIDHGYRLKDDEKIEIPPTIKPMVKIMFNLMLDYAVEYEIVDRNYARSFEISSDVNENIKDNERNHIPFTDAEMKTLWANVNKISDVDTILIQCYMGWRPQELCLLRLEDVNLDKNYIVGGMKTEAGKGRIVPIHPDIKPLIEQKIIEAVKYKSANLILTASPTGKNKTVPFAMNYQRYRKRFGVIIDELKLNPEHKPHDPRKQFITMTKKNGLDEYAIKRIVGHAIRDITEAIYTERDPEWLYREICKIPKQKEI